MEKIRNNNNNKSTDNEDTKSLTSCTKISAIDEPNLRGQVWIGRLVHFADGDTCAVVKCNQIPQGIDLNLGTCLERRTVRLTKIDCAEAATPKKKITPYENLLNTITKNYVLHTILPDEFQVLETNTYDWRKQQKIFDKHCVLLRVDCPLLDSKGKTMELDPYNRDLGSVVLLPTCVRTIENNTCNLSNNEENNNKEIKDNKELKETEGEDHMPIDKLEKEVDIGELLRKVGLADFYEGETKKRTFMTEAGFEKIYSHLKNNKITTTKVLDKLRTLFNEMNYTPTDFT